MIISSIKHIQDNTDITISVNLHSFLPLLPSVLTTYIIPVVPLLLIEKLDTLAEPASGDVTIYAQLLRKLRAAVASLLVASYTARGSVTLNAQGLTRKDSETDKTAYKYQQSAFVQSYFTSYYAHMEGFLALCEKERDAISEWKNSEQQKAYQSLLIKSGTELQSLYAFKHPQLLYAQLMTDMQDVEYIMFHKEFGANYDVLKAKTILSILEKDVLQLLKKAIVFLAYSRYIPKANLSIDAEGIYANTADEATQKSTASALPISVLNLQNSIDATAAEYFTLAKKRFLALIATGSDYTPAVKQAIKHIDNSGSKGSFMM